MLCDKNFTIAIHEFYKRISVEMKFVQTETSQSDDIFIKRR